MGIVDYIRTVVCLVAVLVLVYKYLKANESIVVLLFAAFALRYFSIPIVGPTIDVLYLFSLSVTCFELVSFLSNRTKVSASKLALFVLPIAFFFAYLFVYEFQNNQYLGKFNRLFWYTKTTLNYFKTFLPYFLVGMAVKRQINKIRFEKVYRSIYRIAKISCWIALVQLLCFIVLYNHSALLAIIGLKGGHDYQYNAGLINLVRLQAFFYEPKSLAAFLGLATPVAIHVGNKKSVLLFLVVGFLTLSQTFIVILLAALIVFLLLRKINTVRSTIVCSITIIVGFFFSISTLKNYLLENYATQEETIAYKIFLDRAFQRYTLDDLDENRELFGIPLQPDIELPAVNFLRDNKIFFLTGFGPGNYNLIPFKYFISQWNITAIEEGNFKGHFDMGWLYLVAEFGVFFFCIVFISLTKTKARGFDAKFYAFLWLIFFFHRIDFLLIAFFCLLFYKNLNRENLYNNNILQPGEVS
jgi:hypothetical protein